MSGTGKRVVQWRQRMKLMAIDYKGGRCITCGYDKCVAALQFHHRDATKKDFTISQDIRSLNKVRTELDKCDLLCANCHHERHHIERESDQRTLSVQIDEIKQRPSRKRRALNKCAYCGIDTLNAKYCSRRCGGKLHRRKQRPDAITLTSMVATNSKTVVAALLKVTRTTINRWLNDIPG